MRGVHRRNAGERAELATAAAHRAQARERSRLRRVTRRRVHFHLRAWLLVLATPLAFAFAVLVMVIDREIPAPGWVAERLETEAARVLGDARLDVGSLRVRIGRDLQPVARLVDARIVGPGGLTLTRLQQTEAVLSLRGLAGLKPGLVEAVRLSGAEINLRREADGAMAIALGQDTPGVRGDLAELIADAEAALAHPVLSSLRGIIAENVIVNFDDARAGRSWIIDGGQLSADLRGDALRLDARLALLSGRAGVATLGASVDRPRPGAPAALRLNVFDMDARDIAAQVPALAFLRDIDAPITAALRSSLTADGSLGPLSGVLELGRGALKPDPGATPIGFEAAKTYFTYRPEANRIAFDQIMLDTAWGSVEAEGVATLGAVRAGLPRELVAQLRVTQAVVNPAGLYPQPVRLPPVSVDMRLGGTPFRLDIGQIAIADGDTRLVASARAEAGAEGWTVSADVTANEIAPERLLEFWPEGLKAGSRRWVAENVAAARLTDLYAGLRVAPGQERFLAASFEFDEARVRVLKNQALMEGAVGAVNVSGSRFGVTLDAGHLPAPQGGLLDLAGSAVTIPDTRVRQGPALIDLRATGTLTALLSALNQPRFEFLDKARLPVTLADGRVAVEGRLETRLKPNVSREELDFLFTADLTGMRSRVLVPNRTLVAPRLQARITPTLFEASGPVLIDGVAADGRFTQPIGPGAGPGELTARVTLTPEALDAFNIALPEDSLRGRGEAEFTLTLQRGTAPVYRLTSDLRGLRLALAPVGFEKPPEVPGSLEIEGRLGTDARVDLIALEAPGLAARGVVEFREGGGLEAARFGRVRVGNWLDAPVTVQGRGPGNPPGIFVESGTLDLRRAEFGGGGGSGGASGPVSVALDELRITGGIALTEFRGDFETTGGLAGPFSARLNGRTRIRGSVAPRDGRVAARVVSENGGGVLRSAGLIETVRGGTFDLTLLPASAPGAYDGFLRMGDLRVQDAPAIAELLDAISVVGLLSQLDGQGLRFDAVDARFRLDERAITITEASAIGPGLGISVDGLYTLANKGLDLQGVVSPFYLVNSIGSVLTRRGEGLIGFNFNIRGTAEAPQVSVNPLSVLTPGMFREIFRRPPPEVSE